MQPAAFFERHATRVQTMLSGIGATGVIYPAAFLVCLGEGTLNLGLIFLMRDSYLAAPSLVGWLMGCGTLVYALGCLFVRPRFSGLRPRHLLLLATGGMAVSVGLLYLLRSVALTFVFFSMSRLAASFFWPPAIGWLSQDHQGKALNRILSRFNLSWSLGMMASPAVSGLLSERDPQLPVMGAIVMLSAAFLLIGGAALAVPAAPRARPASGNEPVTHDGQDRSTPLRFTAWIGMAGGYVAAAVIATVFPQYARDALGASKSLVGNVLAVRMLARAAGFFVLGRLAFWHHRSRYQVGLTLYLIGTLTVMTVLRSLAPLAVAVLVLALGNSFSYTSSQFHGVAGSRHRAARTAIHEALLAGAFVVGASVGGLLYQHASFQAALLFCVLCLVLALAAQAAILSRIRRAHGRRRPASRPERAP